MRPLPSPACAAAFLGVAVGAFVPPAAAADPAPNAAAETTSADVTESSPVPAAGVELLLPAPSGPNAVRLRIRVVREGRPANEGAEGALNRLFDFADRDADGVLSPAEAARLPASFELRGLLWGACLPPAGTNAAAALAERHGGLTPELLRDHYLRQGYGLTVAAGRIPLGAALETRLRELLDTDRDGRLSPAERRAAADLLRPFDTNEDESLAAGELLPGAFYPGAVGGELQRPADAAEPRRFVLFAPPPKVADPAELTWEARLVAPPAESSEAKADPAAGTAERLEAAGLRLIVRTDPGQASERVEAACGAFREQFVAADRDGDGVLRPEDVRRADAAWLARLIDAADRDADGRLTRAELDRWLDLLPILTRGQALVSVLDFGDGLFERLDRDADGLLSAAELTAFAAAPVSADADPATVPLRIVHLRVSTGHPRTAMPRPVRGGPEWFVNLDRNADGHVSRAEFPGDDATFARLDRNADGRLTSAEAGP